MSISPQPKEKRSFQFFRTRTLSSSSTESGGGGGGGGGGNNGGGTISPRVSPRSIFDKVVRKRSQTDIKPSNSIEQINQLQLNLQMHLQQQLQQQQLQQQQAQVRKKIVNGHVVNVSRKHLSHSISEEKDEEANESMTELNYRTFHGVPTNAIKINSNSNKSTSYKYNVNTLVMCMSKLRF
jgi:hypothetical protein